MAKIGLNAGLGAKFGLERQGNERAFGKLGHWNDLGEHETVQSIIEDAHVDQALKEMDLTKLSEYPSKFNAIRKLLWRRRAILGELGEI